MIHASTCHVNDTPPGACDCEAVMDRIVEQASRPSPAELMRMAKARGLVNTSVNPYAGAPT